MPNSVKRNENDLNISDEKVKWFSEIAGIAYAEINTLGQVKFSNSARKLLHISKDNLKTGEFIKLFALKKEFKSFLDNIGNQNSHFNTKVKEDNNPVNIVGRVFPESGHIQLLLLTDSVREDLSAKKLLTELERHESQLEIAVQDRVMEIQRLNHELERYKAEISTLVSSHKDSEVRLNTLSDNLPQGAIFRFKYDYSSNKLSLNYAGKFMKELLGVKGAVDLENGEQKLLEMVHPDDKKKYKELTKNFSNRNAEIEFEFRVVIAQRKSKWIYLRAQPNSETPDVIYWDGFLFDITSKKQLEKQLHIIQTSIDKSSEPVYWINQNGNITYFNEAAQRMLGYSEAELLYMPVFKLSAGLAEENWEKQWAFIKDKKFSVTNTAHIHKDGNRIPVEVKANYFNYDNEDYLFVIVTDISEREAARERENYRKQFESLIVDISTRFINIKHDQVDDSINQALKEICLFSKTDSAYIYIFDESYKKLNLKHYFKNSNVNIDPMSIEYYKVDTTSNHFKELLNNGIVQVGSIEEIKEDQAIYNETKRGGIKSFINVALFYQNEFLGFFGLASIEYNRNWDNQEMKLLQVIGDIFVGAVQRKQTVQSLHESEKTYREIYNASSEAIFIHDIDTGEIIDVNTATLEMFKLSYEKALNTNVNDLIADASPLEDRSVLEMLQLAVREPQDFEMKLNKPHGAGSFWAEISIKKAVIHGTERVMVIVRDISNRKNSEQLLMENEAKYRMIVEGQNDLIVKADTDGNLQFVSLSYCKMFGKSEEELIGQGFMPLVHEDDRETTVLAMEKLYKPPHTCYLEQRARTKDGWRWLAWNDTAILNDKGEVSEIIGVGRDITYQKMVENALRESEERFRSIVQNLSDVVFLIDEKANIKYVTPSSEEYLGLEVDALLGYNLKDLIHPDDKWLAEENIQLHIKGNDYNIPYEVRLRYSDTSYRVFEVKSQSMLNHPSVRSIIYTISDITDRKIMEKQVLDAIIKTEEKERERFAKDLHDDLGPLLSSIKMYIGMFDKAKDEEKQKFIVQNLHDIVKEAIATTKEVSNDLNPHVLNNYGIVSALELFIDKVSSNIEIIFQQEIDSSRYTPAIELSVYRISKELINNSIKHSGANQISIKLVERNDSLCLKFEDNGKGLDEKTLVARKPGGMGLSNIISRAKSLNANYNFHTNLDNGFKFDLIVPLIQE